MDPTQASAGAATGGASPQAVQNALMLQALQQGASMQNQPAMDTSSAMGGQMQQLNQPMPGQNQQSQMASPMVAPDPTQMTGGLGTPASPPAGAASAASNPMLQALFSNIPSGGQ